MSTSTLVARLVQEDEHRADDAGRGDGCEGDDRNFLAACPNDLGAIRMTNHQ